MIMLGFAAEAGRNLRRDKWIQYGGLTHPQYLFD
jgi:hypothetical protein